jgi:hypothetical protein
LAIANRQFAIGNSQKRNSNVAYGPANLWLRIAGGNKNGALGERRSLGRG